MTVVHFHHYGAKLKRHKRTVGAKALFCEVWRCILKQKRKFAHEPISDRSVSNEKSSAPFK